jgi:hypothetical protein
MMPLSEWHRADRNVSRCFWAHPTVFLPGSDWIQFAAAEWTCCADPTPRPLEDARPCRYCSRWTDRTQSSAEVRA